MDSGADRIDRIDSIINIFSKLFKLTKNEEIFFKEEYGRAIGMLAEIRISGLAMLSPKVYKDTVNNQTIVTTIQQVEDLLRLGIKDLTLARTVLNGYVGAIPLGEPEAGILDEVEREGLSFGFTSDE